MTLEDESKTQAWFDEPWSNSARCEWLTCWIIVAKVTHIRRIWSPIEFPWVSPLLLMLPCTILYEYFLLLRNKLQVLMHWIKQEQAFKEVKSLRGLSAALGVRTTTQAPLGRAPNTWPSHNIQWEFRFMREGERLWHRPCPMTSLQGSCSPLCVDSVTAHVDPWKIGCAFLPIVLTPINCGLPTNRPFPLGYLTLKWISQALGPLSVCLH